MITPQVRYVLCPGYVTSANDGQEHFISSPKLARLYGVDLRSPNVVVDLDHGFRHRPGDICLGPRLDGNYSLPTPCTSKSPINQKP
jgi:hypothetical protein